ncbi:MAG: hypothetical protein R3A13_00250 [Bdellovibrionota bacterium]
MDKSSMVLLGFQVSNEDVLHDIDNARIERGDTIGNPKLIEDDSLMKFDVVVANLHSASISGVPMG